MTKSADSEQPPSSSATLSLTIGELSERIRERGRAAGLADPAGEETASPPLAFLIDGDRVLYACASPSTVSPCFSAPLRLIQAVHAAFPARARAIIRARIYTDAPITGPATRGMVKVAAKRISGLAEAWLAARRFAGPPELVCLPPAPPGPFFTALPEGEDWPAFQVTARSELGLGLDLGLEAAVALCELAERLAGRVRAGQLPQARAYQRDRAVAALLISPAGELLGWSPNSNASQRTQHAEVNLVQGYLAAGHPSLPHGALIVTSLKPCRMCAGMIWEGAADAAGIRVLYAFDDPGPLARRTVLDGGRTQSGPWLGGGILPPAISVLAE